MRRIFDQTIAFLPVNILAIVSALFVHRVTFP